LLPLPSCRVAPVRASLAARSYAASVARIAMRARFAPSPFACVSARLRRLPRNHFVAHDRRAGFEATVETRGRQIPAHVVAECSAVPFDRIRTDAMIGGSSRASESTISAGRLIRFASYRLKVSRVWLLIACSFADFRERLLCSRRCHTSSRVRTI